MTFAVIDTQYLLTFLGLLVVGLTISSLAVQAREQAESAQSRESQTAELYGLSRDLTTALTTVLQSPWLSGAAVAAAAAEVFRRWAQHRARQLLPAVEQADTAGPRFLE